MPRSILALATSASPEAKPASAPSANFRSNKRNRVETFGAVIDVGVAGNPPTARSKPIASAKAWLATPGCQARELVVALMAVQTHLLERYGCDGWAEPVSHWPLALC